MNIIPEILADFYAIFTSPPEDVKQLRSHSILFLRTLTERILAILCRHRPDARDAPLSDANIIRYLVVLFHPFLIGNALLSEIRL